MSYNGKINKQCTLCNSSESKKIFIKDEILYLKCNNCSFVFSSPVENCNFQEDIEKFEEVYMQYFNHSISDYKNFSSLLSWIKSITTVCEKKILDVGCGSGKFVQYLDQEKIDIFGLEPSAALYNQFLSKNIKFVNSSIKEFASKSSVKYDIITLLDVLEHVDFPSVFIDDIIRLQPSGGILVIEIPLYGSLPCIIFGKKWHFFNKYHLSYFSKERLFKLLHEKGYQLVKYSYRGKYFSLGYILKYILFFFFNKNNTNMFRILENKLVYFNSYDILLGCFRKVS